MKKLKKAFRASWLVAILVLQSLSFLIPNSVTNASAFTGSGKGTTGDPYLIANCTQLQDITNTSSSAVYWLANDIDCSGISNFTPIDEFNGTLDGRGHAISSLYISKPDQAEVGLFSRISSAFILNLSIN